MTTTPPPPIPSSSGDDVNDIIPGSTVGPPPMIIGTGTMQLPSVGLVHVGRLLPLPSVAYEDEGDDDVVTPLSFIFLDDLSLFDLPPLPLLSSLPSCWTREGIDMDIATVVVVDSSSSVVVCGACVRMLGFAPLAVVGSEVAAVGRCSRWSECPSSSAAARVPVPGRLAASRRRRRAAPSSLKKNSIAPPSDVGVANVRADEFATATIVAASSRTPFILSVRIILSCRVCMCLHPTPPPRFNHEKVISSKVKKSERRNLNPSRECSISSFSQAILSQRLIKHRYFLVKHSL